MSKKKVKKQLISLTPDAIVELFEIDFSNMQENVKRIQDAYGASPGTGLKYRFCSSINTNQPIIWKGEKYNPMPIKLQGLESKNDGRFPRPNLTISNSGGVFSRIIYGNDDFVGCVVRRSRTYVRFLDKENFPENINPFGQGDTDAFLPEDLFYINKKMSENKEAIVFELSSSLELTNSPVPARKLMSNLCSWMYRCEIGCGYKGPPIETLRGESLSDLFEGEAPARIEDIEDWSNNNEGGYAEGDVVKIISTNSQNPIRKTPQVFVCTQSHADPFRHHPFLDKQYWAKDDCPKNLSSCKKRFEREGSNSNRLSFGGFPGVLGYEND